MLENVGIRTMVIVGVFNRWWSSVDVRVLTLEHVGDRWCVRSLVIDGGRVLTFEHVGDRSLMFVTSFENLG